MNTQIDVLAVMDAEITDLSQICDAEEVREYCFRQREAVLREARAAVAELIKKAEAMRAMYEQANVSGDWGNWNLEDDAEYVGLRDALARIGSNL